MPVSTRFIQYTNQVYKMSDEDIIRKKRENLRLYHCTMVHDEVKYAKCYTASFSRLKLCKKALRLSSKVCVS